MPTRTDSPQGLTRRQALLMTAGAIAATTVGAAPTGATAPAARPATRSAAAWSPLEQAVRRVIDERVAPGVSVTVLRDDKVAYSAGFGRANIETGTPVTPESVFRIGSISKQFTAAAIALLAEEGKLSFDDRLSRFMPLFPRAGDISLRQMLTHTSGLGNYTDMKSPHAFMQAARLDYDNAQLMALMAATDPLYSSEPGTHWAYSNTAFVLLALVVEIAAREPYGSFYKRRLFERAGLAHTAVDNASEIVPHRANGYSFSAKSASGFDNASFISMTIPHGAGALRSTTEDLCRWHAALLGGHVLAPASLKEMLTPGRLANGELPPMPEAMAARSGTGAQPIEYGFGLAVGEFESRRYAGHDGGINGFFSQLRSFPAERISVAVLANIDGFKDVRVGMQEMVDIRDAAARAALGGA